MSKCLSIVSTLFLAIIVAIFSFTSFSASRAEAGGGGQVSITINAPQSVEAGHKPVNIGVKVLNGTSASVWFDGYVYHGGSGWSGEDYPYTVSSGEVYDAIGDSAMRHFWRGNIPAGSAALYSLPTFSGNQSGTLSVAGTFIVTTTQGIVSTTKDISVVAAVVFPEITSASISNGVAKITGKNLLPQDLTLASAVSANGLLAAQRGANFIYPTGTVWGNTSITWNWNAQLPTSGTLRVCHSSLAVCSAPFAYSVTPVVTASLGTKTSTWGRNTSQIVYLNIHSSIPISFNYNVETTCNVKPATAMAGYPYQKTDVQNEFTVYVSGTANLGRCSFILRGNLSDGTPLPYARADVTITK